VIPLTSLDALVDRYVNHPKIGLKFPGVLSVNEIKPHPPRPAIKYKKIKNLEYKMVNSGLFSFLTGYYNYNNIINFAYSDNFQLCV